ncbi:hypothetical protein ACFQU2_29290 [Siccirubricoccus deserti]
MIGDDDDYARLDPAAGDAVIIATQHRGDHISSVRALRSPPAMWRSSPAASGPG